MRGRLNPDEAGWGGGLRSRMLLAELIDTVNLLRWELACMHTRKGAPRPKRPKRMPRPGVKDPDRKIGRQPIPRNQFRAWWDSRKEAGMAENVEVAKAFVTIIPAMNGAQKPIAYEHLPATTLAG